MDNGASSYRRFLEGDDNGIVEIIRDYKDGLPPLKFVVS
jgi:RNA polymerase sigma-70 factor (ECF subfamily)